ncbi:FAD dependent oxidoreductase-domain-containing protein [Globomyces pollinis-pini]|nr:FAD dependent oxidoreductase-domain-containing protein [Globomyces pollinis-pini]
MFSRRILRTKWLLKSTIAASSATVAYVVLHNNDLLSTTKLSADSQLVDITSSWLPPSRTEMLLKLKSFGTDGKPLKDHTIFDVLIIGGGATGAGCALDAATRGLKTAMVERDDFSCGTSSRSTKLIHGGVRYLEKAFLELDYDQYALVKEALHERGAFMKIAPYLAHEIPIMLPLTQWWKMPYYWAGSKVYDLLAGSQGLTHSYFLSKARAIEAFPMLKKDKISGAIVYYDGAHNDSRMNVAIALTAAQKGAVIANHCEVVELLKKPRETLKGEHGLGDKELYGAVVRDTITGDTWTIYAKGIINATGPFCDGIRKLDSGIETKEIVAPSAGVHVVLPSYFSPRNMGLLDPNTSDGRVIFFLPWQGSVIAGTTDSPTKVESNPVPSDADINWILNEILNYLSPDIKLRRGDVLAAWSGIRPLVRDPAAKNTESLVRNHMINVSENGLLTIAGGKWTTYRAMAEETIDRAVEVFKLDPTGPSLTNDTLLIGSHNWSKNMFIKLIQHFGLETEVAQHLSDNYGDRAWAVASLASQTGARWPIYGTRLAMGYPFIEAEVRYGCQREYACTAVDIMARRTRLGFLNARAALEALPRIIDIMATELNWTKERKAKEYEEGHKYLLTMGLSIKERVTFPADGSKAASDINEDQARFFARTHFLPAEIAKYREIFNSLDYDKDGSISQKDFGRALYTLGVKMNQKELVDVITEVDLNKSGSVEFNEFLEVLAAVKDIRSRSKFARIVAEYQDRTQFPTDRSGGGI